MFIALRTRILWLLVLSAVLLSHAAFAAIPERPKYPIKMDALSDAEFGRLFFAEIDLAHPGLEAAQAAVGKGDYRTAFAAWSEVFMQRMQALPLVPWPTHNWYPLDPPLTSDRVILQHGVFPKDFGPLGRMSWYDL
jgi:hypothetical protein